MGKCASVSVILPSTVYSYNQQGAKNRNTDSGREEVMWFNTKQIHVRFEILTAMTMKMAIFWNIILCSQVNIYWLSEKIQPPPSGRQDTTPKSWDISTRLNGVTSHKTVIFKTAAIQSIFCWSMTRMKKKKVIWQWCSVWYVLWND